MADIRFTVTIDSAQYAAAIEKLATDLGGFVDKTNRATMAGSALGASIQGTTKIGSAFTTMFAGMTTGIVSGQIALNILHKAYEGLKTFLEGSIRASIEAEMIENRLAAALRATGREVDANTQYYLAQAKALESTTIYRHDDIASAEAMLLTLGKLNRDGMDPATKLVIGLAAVYGGDLQTYIRQVSMGFEGQFMQLGRLIPEVRAATTEHDKHAAMVKASAQMYMIAQAQAETFGGKIEQLKNQFHAFQEKIGLAVIHSDQLNAILQLMKATLEALANAPDPTKGPIGKLMMLVQVVSNQLWNNFGPALVYVYTEQMKANAEAANLVGGLNGQVIGYTAAGLAAKRYAETLQAVQAATEAYEKGLTALAVKSGETLKAELKDAEASLNLALARHESVGVVEELAKKVSDLKDKLSGATFELDKFGHLVPKGSQISEPFRDVLPFIEEDNIALAKYTSILGALVGGDLGKVIDQTYEWGAATDDGAFQATKLKTVWEAMTRLEIRGELKLLTAELDRMKASGAYTAEEIDKLTKKVNALKAVLATPTWVVNFSNSLQKMVDVATPILNSLDAIVQQGTTNRTIAIENEYKRRLAVINATVKDETARQQAIIALDAEFEIKRTSAKRAEAKESKAVAYLGAIVNTAEAVTSALKVFPPWLGIALAAVVGTLGAIEVGTIAAQPIPAAKGFEGTVTGPQMFYIEPGMTEHVSIRNRSQGFGGGGGVIMHFHAPFLQTTGISDADIYAVSEKLYAEVNRQMRRIGRG